SPILPSRFAMTVYGFESYFGETLLPVGTEVDAYDPQGVRCGNTTVEAPGAFGVMLVYGDDPETAADEGAEPGDPITFTLNGVVAQPRAPFAHVAYAEGDARRVELNFPGGATATPTRDASQAARASLPLMLHNQPWPLAATPTRTPTATATVEPGNVRFSGLTDQGRAVTLELDASRSQVTHFRIEYEVVCPGATMTGHTESTSPWEVTHRQFTISLPSGAPGKDDLFTGAFSADYSTVNGTWLKWLVEYWPPPIHVACSNAGAWSASPQGLGQ
ncbi:MAG: hypothetical protein GX605_11925, partial [Chloroflexi bacterium]|nr:hypothetical protein [Chloroflexota bacterium]